jgi:hypothetical protein
VQDLRLIAAVFLHNDLVKNALGYFIAMLLLASHASHRNARDDSTLEDGVEHENRCRSNKRSGKGQPALNIAALVEHH